MLYTIILSNGLETKVDEEVYRHFMKHKKLRKWTVNRIRDSDRFYAYKRLNHKWTAMHRVIMEFYGHDIHGKQVDHINGNPLDNRIENLRACSVSENLCNTGPRRNSSSGFKGVGIDKNTGMWRARIRINNKRVQLGLYKTPEEAALAYDSAVDKYHGEFGYKNLVALSY